MQDTMLPRVRAGAEGTLIRDITVLTLYVIRIVSPAAVCSDHLLLRGIHFAKDLCDTINIGKLTFEILPWKFGKVLTRLVDPMCVDHMGQKFFGTQYPRNFPKETRMEKPVCHNISP